MDPSQSQKLTPTSAGAGALVIFDSGPSRKLKRLSKPNDRHIMVAAADKGGLTLSRTLGTRLRIQLASNGFRWPLVDPWPHS